MCVGEFGPTMCQIRTNADLLLGKEMDGWIRVVGACSLQKLETVIFFSWFFAPALRSVSLLLVREAATSALDPIGKKKAKKKKTLFGGKNWEH